ncbi:MAG: DUF3866 family protein [Bacillota bacterium]
MISRKCGIVASIDSQSEEIQWLKVTIDDQECSAINYPPITGDVKIGDSILLNVTAMDLGLGTGGFHIVMANLSKPQGNMEGGGHIMKIRYSPSQIKVMTVEEQQSPFHDKFNEFKSLQNMPIIVGSLHSKLAPAVLGYKMYKPGGKIVYIMTDGGALPISLSKTVSLLKEMGLIAATITIGHSFGGDYEAVNIFTGLIAAKDVIQADAAIVCMGPGIVGTGTTWGFSGIEQGEIINAVGILNGKAITIPRINFNDHRERHKGFSHHTLTVLQKVALFPSLVALPQLPADENEYLKKQIRETRLDDKHTFVTMDSDKVLEEADRLKIPLYSMGKSVEEERYYFSAAAVAGMLAAKRP